MQRDCDVLVCGASFAGLAVARELAGTGARVMVIDRYELGERQTSACGDPDLLAEGARPDGLAAPELRRARRPHALRHLPLAAALVVLDLRLPRAVRAAVGAGAAPKLEFETATVTGREGHTVHTDRGELSAPLIVDGLGWRRVLSNASRSSPRARVCPAGLEVHPPGPGREMELWLDAGYVRAGYCWSFPAGDELRVGVGSFWPSHHVKEPTVRLARDLGLPADGYQGNWIPHQLRAAIEDGVFFAGDSAGHCLPLTAEGIRTALYFGLACGRELRAVLDGSARASRRSPATRPSRTPTRASSAGCSRCSGQSGQITPSRAAGAW